MIIYTLETAISRSELLDLYGDAGWLAYTREPAVLEAAVQGSLCVFTARSDDKLVGLVRVVGDGLTIVYVQDILVLKAFKRRGIGRRLMERVLEKYSSVRQKVLLTDDTPETRGFYEALGFSSCDKGNVVAFTKMSNQPS